MWSCGGRINIPKINFAPGYKEMILSGEKQITIREGIVFGLYPGGLEETNLDIKLRITSLLFTTFDKVSQEDMKADGFSSQGEMIEKLREFYEDIIPEGICTVIRFEVAK